MINLIYLVLLTLPLYLVRFTIFGIPTTVLEIEIYILALWFLVSTLSNKTFTKKIGDFVKNPFFIPLIIFLVAGIISIFVSGDKVSALGIFKAYFFDAAIFFFLFVSLIKDKKQIQNSIVAVIVSALVLSIIGLVHFSGFENLLQEGRIRSVFSSPNYLSLYITPIIFLVFYLFAEPKIKNYILYLSLLVLIAVTILTYSRGAWLAFLVALLFYIGLVIAKRVRRSRNIITAGFIAGVLLILFFITQGSYALNIIPNERVTKSDDVRIEVWKTSWEIGKKNWLLGTGLSNFQNYFGEFTKDKINYPEYITPHALTAHNVFLNIWLQAGLLGLVSLIYLLILFFYYGYKGLRNNFLLSAVLMSSMVAILTQGLVDSSIWKNDLMIFFWFLIGSMLIITSLDTNKSK